MTTNGRAEFRTMRYQRPWCRKRNMPVSAAYSHNHAVALFQQYFLHITRALPCLAYKPNRACTVVSTPQFVVTHLVRPLTSSTSVSRPSRFIDIHSVNMLISSTTGVGLSRFGSPSRRLRGKLSFRTGANLRGCLTQSFLRARAGSAVPWLTERTQLSWMLVRWGPKGCIRGQVLVSGAQLISRCRRNEGVDQMNIEGSGSIK